MTVMNITGCRMFEDEIIDTLSSDKKIDDIIVVDNEECEGIVDKLGKAGFCCKVLPIDKVASVCRSASIGSYVITINILGLSLHADPRYLKDHVYKNVKRIANFSDGIFLFYGLCGNVLKKIERDLEDLPCPVSILKDNEGKIVDDCIGAVVGGRKSFLKIISSFNRKSTLMMTPMWINNWKEMFVHSGFIENEDDIDMARFVLDSMGYENVVKINTDSEHTKDYHRKINEFAELFQLNVLEVEGSTDIVNNSYFDFKDRVLKTHSITSVPLSNPHRSTQSTFTGSRGGMIPFMVRTG